MPKDRFSEEELDGLTEAEREGLLDDSVTDDEIDEPEDDAGDAAEAALDAEARAAAKAAADKIDTDAAAAAAKELADKAAKELAEKDPVAAAKAIADAEAAATAQKIKDDEAAAAAAAAVVEPAKTAAPVVRPEKWQPPAGAADKIAENKTKLSELDAKFDDGELTAAEYRAQQAPLQEESHKLARAMERAEDARLAALDTWSDVTVPAFLEKHAQYAAGSPLHHSLDQEVRKLQVGNKNPYDPEILAKAHKIIDDGVRKAMGLPAAEEKKPTPALKPGEKRVIPPTLAHVPAADPSEIDDTGKFGYLDRLKGVEFDEALAKLSDADRDAYLESTD